MQAPMILNVTFELILINVDHIAEARYTLDHSSRRSLYMVRLGILDTCLIIATDFKLTYDQIRSYKCLSDHIG